MTEPSKAVFLSYASQDAEAARRICEALRAAGIEVWIDQSELRGGDAWDQKIRKQIHDCALFIPIISAHTQARTEGYFRLEWHLADQRKLLMTKSRPFLVPVCIDGTPDADAEVPDSFAAAQWTRLPVGETPPAFVERVSRLLSPESAHAPGEARSPAAPHMATASRPPIPSPAASRQTQRVLVPIAAAVVIGVGYFALDKFVLSKRGTDAAHTSATALSGVTSPTAIPEKSIAVLPFVDMSEKKDQEYFADGMSEEILNLLVKIPGLKVIGRTSSFSFKGKADDLRAIGKTLGAAYVVEGSVRRSGDHIRVTAQLIDTRDGTHRWSETYDRDANDVLKVQGEIAASLVRALQLEVAPSILARSLASPHSREAYDIYLQGMHAQNQYDQRGFEQAVADFRRALDLDPTFVPPAEALAVTLDYLVEWGFVAPQTGWEQARVAAQAALNLDPNSAVGHAILGNIHTQYDWDWPAASKELMTAGSLAPHDPTVLVNTALERIAVGQWTDAVHLFDAAGTVDPLDANIHHLAGWAYLRLGRVSDAENTFRRTLEITPTYGWGHYFLGIALLMEGNTEAALGELEKETSLDARLSGLAIIYHSLHRTKDADAALARLESYYASGDAMSIARTYAFRGQKDQAFKWLDRAYAEKNNAMYLVKGEPLLKNLEGDPRYNAFLHKMNLPE